jgi:hypothetical protein
MLVRESLGGVRSNVFANHEGRTEFLGGGGPQVVARRKHSNERLVFEMQTNIFHKEVISNFTDLRVLPSFSLIS